MLHTFLRIPAAFFCSSPYEMYSKNFSTLGSNQSLYMLAIEAITI